MKSKKQSKNRINAFLNGWQGKTAAVFVVLLVWQAVSLLVGKNFLLPGPVKVFLRIITLCTEKDFLKTVGTTLGHIAAGFGLGLLAGAGLAALADCFLWIKVLLRPWMATIRSVPVAALVIIALLWMNTEGLSIFISFLIVLPIVYTNLLTGLQSRDRKLRELATVYELAPWKRFCHLELPGLIPYLKSAVSVAAGLSWKAGVAAEIIGSPAKSVGHKFYLSRIYIDTDDMFAWTVLVVLLSVLFELAVRGILKVSLKKLTEINAGNADIRDTDDGKDMTGPAVSLRNITKYFGEKKVFESFETVFPGGEISLLHYPSGWGKTTLLYLTAGLLQADEGEVVCENTEGIAMVFQEERFAEEETVLQNIRLFTNAPEEVIEEHLLELGLENCRDVPVSQCSGGMRRRVALARAILAPKALILLDEPFAGLDEESAILAADYLKKHKGSRTVILSTHENVELFT